MAKNKNDREVRFNVTIAGYRHGQIVKYGDMPAGQQFWVDNKSILGSDRICEFLDEIKPEKKEPERPEVFTKADVADLLEEIERLKTKNENLKAENDALVLVNSELEYKVRVMEAAQLESTSVQTVTMPLDGAGPEGRDQTDVELKTKPDEEQETTIEKNKRGRPRKDE